MNFFNYDVATTPNTISEMAFTTTQIKDVYNRSYYKVQNLAADVGGVIKFIMIIFTFLNQFLGHRVFIVNLTESVCNFQHSPENEPIVGQSLTTASNLKSVTLKNVQNNFIVPKESLHFKKKRTKLKLYVLLLFMYMYLCMVRKGPRGGGHILEYVEVD